MRRRSRVLNERGGLQSPQYPLGWCKREGPAKQIDDVAIKYKRKSDIGSPCVEGGQTECIKEVLKDHEYIFPQNSPLGLLLVKIRHEFKTCLKDNIPPIHGTLYKLNTLDVQEPHNQTQ